MVDGWFGGWMDELGGWLVAILLHTCHTPVRPHAHTTRLCVAVCCKHFALARLRSAAHTSRTARWFSSTCAAVGCSLLPPPCAQHLASSALVASARHSLPPRALPPAVRGLARVTTDMARVLHFTSCYTATSFIFAGWTVSSCPTLPHPGRKAQHGRR